MAVVEICNNKELVPETWVAVVETYNSKAESPESPELVLVQACSTSCKESWEHMQMA